MTDSAIVVQTTANKRAKFQIEADLTVEARMYLEGHTQAAITQWIGENRDYTLSRTQVGKDIQKIRDRWVISQLVDFDTAKAKELTRIDMSECSWKKLAHGHVANVVYSGD